MGVWVKAMFSHVLPGYGLTSWKKQRLCARGANRCASGPGFSHIQPRDSGQVTSLHLGSSSVTQEGQTKAWWAMQASVVWEDFLDLPSRREMASPGWNLASSTTCVALSSFPSVQWVSWSGSKMAVMLFLLVLWSDG